jgi:hypothetical protein
MLLRDPKMRRYLWGTAGDTAQSLNATNTAPSLLVPEAGSNESDSNFQLGKSLPDRIRQSKILQPIGAYANLLQDSPFAATLLSGIVGGAGGYALGKLQNKNPKMTGLAGAAIGGVGANLASRWMNRNTAQAQGQAKQAAAVKRILPGVEHYLIGTIDSYGGVRSVGTDLRGILQGHNRFGLSGGLGWRFHPVKGCVVWDDDPGAEAKIAVENYLGRKGYPVEQHTIGIQNNLQVFQPSMYEGGHKQASMFSTTSGDLRYITQRLTEDQTTGQNVKGEIFRALESLTPNQVSILARTIKGIFGASVGAVIARYVAGLGVAGTALGAAAGGLWGFGSPFQSHNAFGQTQGDKSFSPFGQSFEF